MSPNVKTINIDQILAPPPTLQEPNIPNFGLLQPITVQELPYEGFMQWLFGIRKYKVLKGGEHYHTSKRLNRASVVCTVFPEGYEIKPGDFESSGPSGMQPPK